MALSCSKMNKRAILTIFSSFLRQKQLWNLYFQFFFREVSYDVLSSEIMLMGQGQGGGLADIKDFLGKLQKMIKIIENNDFFSPE